MTGSSEFVETDLDGRRAVLNRLEALAHTIGSANDAEDHGYREDAERMRGEACGEMRDMMTSFPFLVEVLPKLKWELESGHIIGFGWAALCDDIAAVFEAPHRLCGVCSGLADRESSRQKYGWEEHDTHLPAASARLALVLDFRPHSSRERKLLRCPECRTYYLYETDYEYLVNGSEDEQTLTRLTQDQAQAYLRGTGEDPHAADGSVPPAA